MAVDASEPTASADPGRMEQLALEAVARRLLGRRRTVEIGRYQMAEELGRGGFGAVYAGRDPKLDRAVALKLVLPRRGESDPRWEARLVREAQALAQLRHPNVVEVFDVGVDDRDGGTHGVYIVMELLGGVSLRTWAKDEPPPPWRAVVRTMRSVAAGLAAAHAEGIIHRDVKPDNVMLTDAGQIKLIDFGLAREAQAEHSYSAELPTLTSGEVPVSGPSGALGSGRSASGSTLTSLGSVMGTPVYMAPEQHDSSGQDSVGPASDQYAFCVMLFELLYGVRPFSSKSTEELLIRKVSLDVAAVPKERAVPRALHRIVMRGLAAKPEDRWPSMEALGDALDATVRGGRRFATVSGVLAAGIVASVAAAAVTPTQDPLCRETAELRSKLWSSERAASVQAALLGDAATTAAASWTVLDGRMRDQLEEWSTHFGRACDAADATTVACLDRWLRDADTALTVIAESDEPQEHAIAVVSGLAPVEQCVSQAGIAVRSWASLADREDPLRRDLARARVLAKAGQGAEALALAEEALERARQQDDEAVLAFATMTAGLVFAERERLEDAKRLLTESVALAGALGLDAVAVEAATGLIRVCAALGDFDSAGRWTHFAQARVARLGEPLFMRRWLLAARIFASIYEGEDELAYRLGQSLVELFPKGAMDVERGRALANVAMAAFQLGRMHEAIAISQDAVELLRGVLGPEHPGVGRTMSDAGSYLAASGEVERGVQMMTEGVALLEAAGGPEDPYALHGKRRLAHYLALLGRTDESYRILRQVYDATVRLYGVTHVRSATTAFALADASLDAGQPDEAIRLAREGMGALTELFGAGSPRLARGAEVLAAGLTQRGDYEEARAVISAASEGLRLDDPAQRESTINLLLAMAALDQEVGRLDDAARGLERAIDLCRGHPSSNDPAMIASLEGERAFVESSRGRAEEAVVAAGRALAFLQRNEATPEEMKALQDLIAREGVAAPTEAASPR